jgi:hypothetical protein
MDRLNHERGIFHLDVTGFFVQPDHITARMVQLEAVAKESNDLSAHHLRSLVEPFTFLINEHEARRYVIIIHG